MSKRMDGLIRRYFRKAVLGSDDNYELIAQDAMRAFKDANRTIHRLEVKLGKRRRKSARQHNALSAYKRRDFYAMKSLQTSQGTYQFPQMTAGLPAARLP